MSDTNHYLLLGSWSLALGSDAVLLPLRKKALVQTSARCQKMRLENLSKFGNGLVCASATANRGTMAGKSTR
jgi:hypothetical protein